MNERPHTYVVSAVGYPAPSFGPQWLEPGQVALVAVPEANKALPLYRRFEGGAWYSCPKESYRAAYEKARNMPALPTDAVYVEPHTWGGRP